jgi:ferredoxin-NADP reductase
VAAHVTRLLKRRDLTDDTASFVLARPEGFAYRAGQSINLTLVEPAENDAKGATRTFSLVSAPSEPALEIATRLRTSAFKRVLASLAPGAPLQMRGPGGKFVLAEGDRPVVMVAGGIGITPFVGMLRDCAARGDARAITLLYSSRRAQDAPYLEELMALQRRMAQVHIVYTSTSQEAGSRAGSAGHGPIDAAMIAQHVPDVRAPSWMLAGPPGFVGGLRKALVEAGAEAADVHLDEFYGY